MSSPTIERIKERLSIVDVLSVYLKFEKAGAHLKAKCPFHNEKTPSFFVSPTRNSYYCFGCGAKGDIFSFVQQFEGVDFMGALKILADRAGVPLVQESPEVKKEHDRRFALLEVATKLYQSLLFEQKEVIAYLTQRGLTKETIKDWRIGYASDAWRNGREYFKKQGFSDTEMAIVGLIRQPEGGKEPYDWFRSRIMFPLFDVSGRPVAFSGRLFGHEEREGLPKYINSPETPLFSKSRLLFGMHFAKNTIRKRNYSILVEGQVDVVLSHQAGFDNTVASSGTALTKEQLEQLARLSPNIIMAFDSDAAGAKAAIRSARLALSLGMDVKIARLPDGLDPADAVKTDPSIWTKAIRDSVPLISFFVTHVKRSISDPHKRDRAIVSDVLPFVASMKSATEQSRAIADIAFETGQREAALWEDMKRLISSGVVLNESDTLVMSNPSISSKEVGKKEGGVYRRIAAILAWQSTLSDSVINPKVIEQKLKEVDPLSEERIIVFDGERDILIYEAELLHSSIRSVEVELDELIEIVRKDVLEKTYANLHAQLLQAEKVKDHVLANTLLIQCRELAKKINDSPPKAA